MFFGLSPGAKTVIEGQYVYQQGETSEVFFVIATGEAELFLGRSDGRARVVGRIGLGGHFGETGILTGKPRSLSVRALSDMEVICFDKRYFRTAFLSNSRIHQLLDAALAERLRVAFVDQVDPLGAVNAIFAMPAVVELRSNRHVCLNRCQSHSCFAGDADVSGCPMFRHPYLVDNNKDCIMCAKCIKNCDNSSIQLNLRLAPQDLWALETPMRADSFLIVSMGAIFFSFALQKEFAQLVSWMVSIIALTGVILSESVVGSMLFFYGSLFSR